MPVSLIHLAILGASLATASPAPSVPESWIERTAWLESRNRDYHADGTPLIGAAGERTRYQFMRRTWEHYSSVPFELSQDHPAEARRVCRLVLADCIRACRRHREPATFHRVRWYYRHGGFRHAHRSAPLQALRRALRTYPPQRRLGRLCLRRVSAPGDAAAGHTVRFAVVSGV